MAEEARHSGCCACTVRDTDDPPQHEASLSAHSLANQPVHTLAVRDVIGSGSDASSTNSAPRPSLRR